MWNSKIKYGIMLHSFFFWGGIFCIKMQNFVWFYIDKKERIYHTLILLCDLKLEIIMCHFRCTMDKFEKCVFFNNWFILPYTQVVGTRVGAPLWRFPPRTTSSLSRGWKQVAWIASSDTTLTSAGQFVRLSMVQYLHVALSMLQTSFN